jgi:hypothetical protein
MALFGLFGSDKISEKGIEKQVTKLKERYAQPDYRRMAMEKLMEWGTPEALDGVLKRFTITVQSPHWDEQEKAWLMDELTSLGEPAKEALLRFLDAHQQVIFPLRVLARMVEREEMVSIIIAALQKRAPEDYRAAEGKQELVAALMDYDDGRIPEVVLPYLDDHADDVQCIAIDLIKAKKAEAAFGRLRDMITEDEHSARVLRHAAGAAADLSIDIDPEKPLVPAVAEDFVVKDGKLASNRPS